MGNKKLVPLGGGGHCKAVLDTIMRLGEYSDIVITDPDIEAGTLILGVPVVGNDEMLQRLFENGYHYAFITVGSLESPKLRKELVSVASRIGFEFPAIIDLSAIVAQSAIIRAGTFIGKNVIINAESYVGCHCIINTGSILEHGCRIGDFTHISVGSILCGNVMVGLDALIGAGSTLIQGVKIGNGVVVGANSTVLDSVGDNMIVYGIEQKQRGEGDKLSNSVLSFHQEGCGRYTKSSQQGWRAAA